MQEGWWVYEIQLWFGLGGRSEGSQRWRLARCIRNSRRRHANILFFSPAMIPRRLWQGLLAPLLLAIGLTSAYEVPVSDTDYDNQICSGMWGGGKNTFINGAPFGLSLAASAQSPQVTFDASSQGQLAMVIYEWKDMPYLGKVTTPDGTLPVSTHCQHLCTDIYNAPFRSRRPMSVHLTLCEAASVTVRN